VPPIFSTVANWLSVSFLSPELSREWVDDCNFFFFFILPDDMVGVYIKVDVELIVEMEAEVFLEVLRFDFLSANRHGSYSMMGFFLS
jgi:hypothetical protein